MAATTKEITDKLLDMMTSSHRRELQKLIAKRTIDGKLARDLNFAFSEGAKQMLHHLTEMGIVLSEQKTDDPKGP